MFSINSYIVILRRPSCNDGQKEIGDLSLVLVAVFCRMNSYKDKATYANMGVAWASHGLRTRAKIHVAVNAVQLARYTLSACGTLEDFQLHASRDRVKSWIT